MTSERACHRLTKLTKALLLLPFVVPAISAQAPKGPAKLALEVPSSPVTGKQATVSIHLLDASGHPAVADSDIKLRAEAPGVAVDRQTVTIPKGSGSAELGISKDKPGISSLRVEQTEVPTGGLQANSQISFLPAQSYTPVPPMSLWLSVQPATKFKAGLETATLIVRYVDSHKVSIPIRQDTSITFPGLTDKISPNPIHIASGEMFGEANLADPRPEIVSLAPVPSPPQFIVSDSPTVEFVSPIVGLRLIAERGYIEALRRPRIELKLGLLDGQGNWIASDKDRTILLRTEPSTGGVIGNVEITIPKGNSVAETTFLPSGEGKTTIKAVVGDNLVVEPTEIEFKYAYPYFWILAMLGGMIGGGVRNVLGAEHSLKTIAVHCIGGAATGWLTYLLLPLLVSLSLKPINLQTSSKVFEAFVWGFIGGGSGIAIIGRIFAAAQTGKAPRSEPA